jgi:Threonine synthase
MKYNLKCRKCGYIIKDFVEWFGHKQFCPKCGARHVEAIYSTDYSILSELLQNKPSSFWNYFDFLPLENKENMISFDEGAILLEEWEFLNRFAAEKYGVNCRVYAYRNDLNGGTGTLKDVAASMTASALKECGIDGYCVASTGNTATANARYLAKAGIKFTNFAPAAINNDTIAEIRSYGQEVVISEGDYAQAKQEATAFSDKNDIPISIGNIDPLRIESKRTMAFEFIRQLGKMPDVYMQAVGGGTGPIALDKGFREIEEHLAETKLGEVKLPRMLLIQQDLCDPMVQAWEKAKENGFPEKFENDFPKIENPPTSVFILSAGNPGMYPLVAKIVKKSGGDFLRIKEAELTDFARIVHKEKGIYIGPAATVCFAGFYQALKEKKIKDGETIVFNIGESGRRYSDFVSKL